MLDNNKGILFDPIEEWRTEVKTCTHALNQKYNALTEYQVCKAGNGCVSGSQGRTGVLHERLAEAGGALR